MSSTSTFVAKSASGNTPVSVSPVQGQYEHLTAAISDLRDQIERLDERLGYVSQARAPHESGENKGVTPMSPMAHNLYCATNSVNELAYRVQDMIGRLEI